MDEIIVKKSGEDTFTWNKACEHGIKYEPITNMMYEMKTGHKVYEFGCIPDESPGNEMFAASPDGIRLDGVMVEYKNPSSRKISGYPMPCYYAQIQQQLKVADLELAHFVESKIIEYDSKHTFYNDICNTNPTMLWTSDGKQKGAGIVICLVSTSSRPEFKYEYAPLTLRTHELKKWITDKESQLKHNVSNYESIRTFYWRCEKYSCIEIYRHRGWWKEHVPLLKKFWNTLCITLQDDTILHKSKKRYEDYSNNKNKYYRKSGNTTFVCDKHNDIHDINDIFSDIDD